MHDNSPCNTKFISLMHKKMSENGDTITHHTRVLEH